MKDTKELTADKAPDGAVPDYSPFKIALDAYEVINLLWLIVDTQPTHCTGDWHCQVRWKLHAAAAVKVKYGEDEIAVVGDALHCRPNDARLGERAAPAAPSSPESSALKTEDQQELTKAAAPRSPEEALYDRLRFSSFQRDDLNSIRAALHAAESRGRERGIEEAAQVASAFSVKADRQLHPDIPWEQMSETAQTVAHMTAQSVAYDIRALKGNAAPQATPSESSARETELLKALRAARETLHRAAHVGEIYFRTNALAAGVADDIANTRRMIESALTSGASAAEPPKEAVKSGLTE